MCKLRTIPKAYQYLKELDPETDITEYFIRKLAQQKKISLTKSGRKIWVDVDSIILYLQGENFSPVINRV